MRLYDQSRLSFKSQGTEKIELFLQEADDSINLRYQSLITVDYKKDYKETPSMFPWV